MKKKAVKKLVLAKETVRNLEKLTLSEVVGGATVTDCNACTYDNSCQRFCLDEPLGPVG
jgi:hypothetical protein